MCPDCEKWKKKYISALVDQIAEAADYYEYLKQEYGEHHELTKSIGEPLVAIALLLHKQPKSKWRQNDRGQ